MWSHLHLPRPHLSHHLLLHQVLVSHWNGHEELRDTFDQPKNEASHQCLLERHRGSTTNGQNASSDAAWHNRIITIVFLSVGDQHALAAGKHAAPETEVSSKERGSVPYVAQSTEHTLAFGSVYETYRNERGLLIPKSSTCVSPYLSRNRR